MNLRNFWSCIKRSYQKLSFFEFLTIIFFAFIISGIIVGDVLASDALTVKYQVPIPGGGTPQSLPLYINMVYKWLMGAGLVLVGIMVTIGGFMYVSSGGDAKNVGTGKKYITNALIGMLLLSSAYLILNTINPDATEMEDIVIKQVEGEVLKSQIEVPLGCECYKDTDCITSATNAYFCDWTYGGKLVYDASNKSKLEKALDPYAEYIIFATIFLAVALGTAGTGIPTLVASKAAAAGKTALTVGKIVGKVTWPVAKFTFKWVAMPVASAVVGAVIANPVGAFLIVLMFAGGAAIDFNTTIVKKCNSPSGDVKGVCLPNAFLYGRLKPHGAGVTDVDDFSRKTNQNGILSIYNLDGTLPKRTSYFRDESPLSLAVADKNDPELSTKTIEHFYRGGYTQGIANADGCASFKEKYAATYCPCIEWENDFIFTKCKKVATCATLEMENINVMTIGSGGTYSQGPTLKKTEICLTGTEGELCKSNDDCGKGLECVSLEELGKSVFGDDWRKFAIKYSVFRKSVRTSLTDLGSGGTIKGGWDRDKVCMYSKNADKASLTLSLQKSLMGIADIGELQCKPGLITTIYKANCSKLRINIPYCGSSGNDSLVDLLKNGSAGKMTEVLYDEAIRLAGSVDIAEGTMISVWDNTSAYVDATIGQSNLTHYASAYKYICDYLNSTLGFCNDVRERKTVAECTTKALASYNKNYIRKNGNDFVERYRSLAPVDYDYYRFEFLYDDFKDFCLGIDGDCPCDLKGLKKMYINVPEITNLPILMRKCITTKDAGIYKYTLFNLLIEN